MKATVSLCSGWRELLGPGVVEAMTPISVDPIGRESWVCDRAHAGLLQKIHSRGAAIRYHFEVSLGGTALTEGECRDQKSDCAIIVRPNSPISPTGQVVCVSARSLDWAAAAMSHVLSGEHFATPFVAASLARPSGSYQEMIAPFERLMLVSVLSRNNWSRQRSAAELGISRQTLHNRMVALELYQDLAYLWRKVSSVEQLFLTPTLAG